MVLKKYPTQKELNLLNLMLSKEFITFKEQNIYTNKRSFINAIHTLLNNSVVAEKDALKHDGFLRTFYLTFEGYILINHLNEWK